MYAGPRCLWVRQMLRAFAVPLGVMDGCWPYKDSPTRQCGRAWRQVSRAPAYHVRAIPRLGKQAISTTTRTLNNSGIADVEHGDEAQKCEACLATEQHAGDAASTWLEPVASTCAGVSAPLARICRLPYARAFCRWAA